VGERERKREREIERERETGGPEKDGNSSSEWITTTNTIIIINMMEERTTICPRKMTGIGICYLTPPGRNSSERYAL